MVADAKRMEEERLKVVTTNTEVWQIVTLMLQHIYKMLQLSTWDGTTQAASESGINRRQKYA